MIIRKKAYPRAALVGNPSDGYFGRTIAATFANFHAQVVLYETSELKILPFVRDKSEFSSIADLAEDVRHFGYYGGIRLLKATIKRFYDYCQARDLPLHNRNFTIRYYSSIPHMVGLAGSSAIITACLHALMEFYRVSIPEPLQANLVLSVENDELRIPAGLQDRVAQVYGGLVYMDFDRQLMERQGYGRYERLPIDTLPNLYIAYRRDWSEESGVLHSNLRERHRAGDHAVLEAIELWKELTDKVKALLLARRGAEIGPLLDANFDIRARVCSIDEGNMKMIRAARSTGASAKFTGSGGAIIGTYEDDEMFASLRRRLAEAGAVVLKPAWAEAPISCHAQPVLESNVLLGENT